MQNYPRRSTASSAGPFGEPENFHRLVGLRCLFPETSSRDQLLGSFAVFAKRCRPDIEGHLDRFLFGDLQRGPKKGRIYPFDDLAGHLLGCGRQNGKKLVIATPGQKIHIPKSVSHYPRNMTQDTVTRGMAEPLVDPVKILYIDGEQRQRPLITFALRFGDMVFEDQIKGTLVGQVSRIVDQRFRRRALEGDGT